MSEYVSKHNMVMAFMEMASANSGDELASKLIAFGERLKAGEFDATPEVTSGTPEFLRVYGLGQPPRRHDAPVVVPPASEPSDERIRGAFAHRSLTDEEVAAVRGLLADARPRVTQEHVKALREEAGARSDGNALLLVQAADFLAASLERPRVTATREEFGKALFDFHMAPRFDDEPFRRSPEYIAQRARVMALYDAASLAPTRLTKEIVAAWLLSTEAGRQLAASLRAVPTGTPLSDEDRHALTDIVAAIELDKVSELSARHTDLLNRLAATRRPVEDAPASDFTVCVECMEDHPLDDANRCAKCAAKKRPADAPRPTLEEDDTDALSFDPTLRPFAVLADEYAVASQKANENAEPGDVTLAMPPRWKLLRAIRAALTAAAPAPSEDTKRVDWLDENIRGKTREGRDVIRLTRGSVATLRATIDAYRAAQRPTTTTTEERPR